MSDIRIDSVLTELRRVAARSGLDAPSAATEAKTPDGMGDFGSAIKNAVDSVNDRQQRAVQMTERFERGEPGADLARVMIEMQKARVSFEAVSQVRNKLVEAYKDVMNMQV